MDYTEWKTIGEIVGLTASGLGIVYGLIRFCLWIKTIIARRKQMKTAILDGIKKLCAGQREIWEYLGTMNELRERARNEDAVIRGNQYLGTIAMIAAIREMAKSMGITINGEVQKYYEQNIEALRAGLGMVPLEVKKESGKDAVQV